MQLKQGNFCPLIKKDCVQMKCNLFIQIRGKNPNTGKDVDEWGCTVSWLPHLLIQTSQQTRQAGAATESFKNEFKKAAQATINTMVTIANHINPSNELPMRLINDNKNDDNQG